MARPWGRGDEKWTLTLAPDGTMTAVSKYGDYLAAYKVGEDTRGADDEGVIVALADAAPHAFGATTSWEIKSLNDTFVTSYAPHATVDGNGIFLKNVASGCALSAYGVKNDERTAPVNEATVVCRPWSLGDEIWLVEDEASSASKA